MTIATALFLIFSGILLFAAFRVITAASAVVAALYLVLAFFNAACVWMLLEAEFLAISLVLVYVGAVMVLFLFVVMMLDANAGNAPAVREGFWKHLPVALAIGVVVALEMSLVLLGGFRLTEATPLDDTAAKLGNTKLLGIEIYGAYLYPLEIAAVLLLVAIVAAIALTLRERKDSKYTNPSEQVLVRKADRVRLVKMRAERPVTEPATAAPDPATSAALVTRTAGKQTP